MSSTTAGNADVEMVSETKTNGVDTTMKSEAQSTKAATDQQSNSY